MGGEKPAAVSHRHLRAQRRDGASPSNHTHTHTHFITAPLWTLLLGRDDGSDEMVMKNDDEMKPREVGCLQPSRNLLRRGGGVRREHHRYRAGRTATWQHVRTGDTAQAATRSRAAPVFSRQQ